MQPIIDLNLLKHHRVDYGARKTEAAGAWRPLPSRAIAVFVIVVFALGLASSLTA